MLSSFVSLDVTREGGIKISDLAIAATVTTFLGCLGADIIDLLEFTAWTRVLGYSKENIVLFLEIFQHHFTIIFSFMIMLDSIGLFTQGPSQSIFDGCLVGTFTKEILWAMQFLLAFRNFCLIAQYSVTLGTMLIRSLLYVLILGRQDTNISFLFMSPLWTHRCHN